MSIVWGLLLAAVVLVVLLGIGALILLKLGVIAHYAVKDESAQEGDYGLDQSHEVGEDQI
jgi:hypothetical protein